jgi:hypothetical protein
MIVRSDRLDVDVRIRPGLVVILVRRKRIDANKIAKIGKF